MSIKTDKLISSSGSREIPVDEISNLGMGQTWQAAELTDTGAVFTDGTPKYRAAGVTYTNNTGGVVVVSVNVFSGDTAYALVVDDEDVASLNLENGVTGNLTVEIPKDSTYSLSAPGGFASWLELRK